MSTIKDVADRAGVSRSTVSYALSGHRSISSSTKQRIDQAIAELGYTANAGARALKTAQTHVLAALLQFHEDEFAPAMLQYLLPIATVAREHGFDLMMITDPDGPAALRRITASDLVDGVVLLDVRHHDPRLDVLRTVRQPGVLVGLPGHPAGFDVFDLDFEAGASSVVDHLAGLGHRQIALVTPPQHVSDRGGAYAWRFRDAARQRAAEHGLQLSVVPGASRQPAITRSLHQVLDDHPDVTALIVHNDATVPALPMVLRERQVVVPRDLSVVSLYSGDFGRQFMIDYTALETVPDQLARLAVTRLVERLGAARRTGTEVRLLPPALIDRGSTGPVPG